MENIILDAWVFRTGLGFLAKTLYKSIPMYELVLLKPNRLITNMNYLGKKMFLKES